MSLLDKPIAEMTGRDFLELCREVGLVKRIPAVDLRAATPDRPLRIEELAKALDTLLGAPGVAFSAREVAEKLGTSQPSLNRLHKAAIGKARAYQRNGEWFWWLPI